MKKFILLLVFLFLFFGIVFAADNKSSIKKIWEGEGVIGQSITLRPSFLLFKVEVYYDREDRTFIILVKERDFPFPWEPDPPDPPSPDEREEYTGEKIKIETK